mgnify:CR=1 FL=1
MLSRAVEHVRPAHRSARCPVFSARFLRVKRFGARRGVILNENGYIIKAEEKKRRKPERQSQKENGRCAGSGGSPEKRTVTGEQRERK